ncbi:MAG: insulinase family protein [Clostridiales bacterium]|jgi:predicted Zn-dependent peptidase|nr:insulinase family protein [Clostridiales bacterium]
MSKYINAIIKPDNKFKTITICVMLRRTLKREESTLNALLTDVMSAGCDKYRNLYEINKHMELMFGSVFNGQVVKKGEFQIIRFYTEVLAGDEKLLKQAIEFLNEVINKPYVVNGGFDEEIFNVEKNMLKDAILERINDKGEYARLKCIELMCKDEPFGVYTDGYLPDLESIDRISLYNHYKKVVAETPLEFVITGDVDSNICQGLIEEIFGEIANVNSIEAIEGLVYNPREKVEYTERLDIGQGKICMGLRANADCCGHRFYALLLMTEILGGSANSKLFVNVREKNSLCYSIFAFVYRVKSIVMIQSGVELDNMDIALNKINEQIESLKNGDVSSYELDMAKKSIISHFKSMRDYQGTMLDFYYTGFMLNDKTTIEEAIGYLEKVEVKDVVDMAKTLYTDTVYLLKEA